MIKVINALAIIKNAIKTNNHTPVVILNSKVEKTLSILRDIGTIQGFTIFDGKSILNKAKVFLKFIDHKTPVLKNIYIYKNTKSNFIYKKPTIKTNDIYLLTSLEGITTSKKPVNGRIIAKFTL